MSGQEKTDETVTVRIVGLVSDVKYHVARNCAMDLAKSVKSPTISVEVLPLLEFEWTQFIRDTIRQCGDEFWAFNEQVLVLLDGQPRGSAQWLLEWAMQQFAYEDFRPLPLYQTLTEDAYAEEYQRRQHDFVFLDVAIGSEPAGRLVLELLTDIVPRTCRNFKQLCTGEQGVSKHNAVEQFQLCYKNSLFHRIVPEGWIQGGDIWYGKGTGGESIYGATFEDENFAVRHDARGVLSMANRGRHTNGSQFFITLKPSLWMDTKFVAFGRVVEGSATLEKLEAVQTINERPQEELRIVDCGIFEPKLTAA